ncbi:uncharacterized protein [Euphorbia lathyris]|uniref:uncharacterized protein n=1 Tax=Euphorbia lathyris TaxID=212925 RepID=UPI0033138363
MLLRSSSTPILGSLISSVSDTPNNFHRSPSPYHQIGSFNFTSISCNSSPISPSVSDLGLRRAQSGSNLEGSASAYDDYQNLANPKKIPGRQKCSMLETIPSFSLDNSRGRFEEEDEEDGDYWSEIGDEEGGFEAEANGNLSNRAETVGLLDRSWNAGIEGERGFINEEMYLARGLGIDNNGNGSGGRGGGGGGGLHWTGGGDGGDRKGTEEYYKMMVQQNPGNPLLLRNYAQFLYQTKRDLLEAQEYYSRAILADPKDGEILSQYATLIWELNGNEEKTSSYHERAVQASPEDSHVHAAYASFLWEIEDDEDEFHSATGV